MQHTDKYCVGKTLKIIGSKWTVLLIRELCEGTRRFNELQRALDGISPKTLSLRLKQLEKDGIISKTIFAEIPPRTEYTLTQKGLSLRDIIEKMREWGDKS